MTRIPFTQMHLTPKVERAVSLMGFDFATPVQSEAIPVIRTGVDVIARSQTGTGKTVAFAIPAIERVDTHQEKNTIQALIICPTRELAVQAAEEIRKLARFKEGIRPVAIYGGASIEKQCIDLRKANMVIGTPGRIMDHMRRRTIKLHDLKLIVLDEADEMLNMGFKEDIETILSDTPENRQTVLFSATMPPAIMKITKEFQKDPVLIEINKEQVTIQNIKQYFFDVPHTSKKDALALLLSFYKPKRAIVFCATKKMADELAEFLNESKIRSDIIHSDIKQSQRTNTMRDFKSGKTHILIATDIAARGIDVNDIEYVINYDIPSNTEYYIHRIGRTGRAGKDGCSITICSSRREVSEMRQMAVAVKSDVQELILPTPQDIQKSDIERAVNELETRFTQEIDPIYTEMTEQLLSRGYTYQEIAQVALSLNYQSLSKPITTVVNQIKHGERKKTQAKKSTRTPSIPGEFSVMVMDIGTGSRVNANHIVAAVTDRCGISGKEIGKIRIMAEQSFVEIPKDLTQAILETMKGVKICGKQVHVSVQNAPRRKSSSFSGRYGRSNNRNTSGSGRSSKRSEKRAY